MILLFLLYIMIPFVLMMFGVDSLLSMLVTDITVYAFVLYDRIKHPIKREKTNCLFLLIMIPLFMFTGYLWSKWYMLHIADNTSIQYRDSLQSYVGSIFYIIMIGIAAPMGEESLFRYVMINTLCEKLGNKKVLTIIISSVIFAIVHGTGVHLLVGFICGMLFGTVYMMTNRLSLSILLHSFYNLGTLFVVVPNSFPLCIVFSIISIAFFFIMVYNRSCK